MWSLPDLEERRSSSSFQGRERASERASAGSNPQALREGGEGGRQGRPSGIARRSGGNEGIASSRGEKGEREGGRRGRQDGYSGPHQEALREVRALHS